MTLTLATVKNHVDLSWPAATCDGWNIYRTVAPDFASVRPNTYEHTYHVGPTQTYATIGAAVTAARAAFVAEYGSSPSPRPENRVAILIDPGDYDEQIWRDGNKLGNFIDYIGTSGNRADVVIHNTAPWITGAGAGTPLVRVADTYLANLTLSLTGGTYPVWATGTAYAVGDVVLHRVLAGSTWTATSYTCLVAHTAGVFFDDVAALPHKWAERSYHACLYYNQASAGAGYSTCICENVAFESSEWVNELLYIIPGDGDCFLFIGCDFHLSGSGDGTQTFQAIAIEANSQYRTGIPANITFYDCTASCGGPGITVAWNDLGALNYTPAADVLAWIGGSVSPADDTSLGNCAIYLASGAPTSTRHNTVSNYIEPGISYVVLNTDSIPGTHRQHFISPVLPTHGLSAATLAHFA